MILTSKNLQTLSPQPAGFVIDKCAFDKLGGMLLKSATDADSQDTQLRLWLASIAQGDKDALGKLYDATLGKVYGLALRITGKAESAEEVVSDVYFQAYRDAARFDAGRGVVIAWLLMITRSRALDHLRRRDIAESHPEPHSLHPERHIAEACPLDRLLELEGNARLIEAMNELLPLQRQMLALSFFRDLSHQEIAGQTGIPLGTVKSHIRRALEKLKPLLISEAP